MKDRPNMSVFIYNKLMDDRDALLRVVKAGKSVIEAYDAFPEDPYGEVGERRSIYFEALKDAERSLNG